MARTNFVDDPSGVNPLSAFAAADMNGIGAEVNGLTSTVAGKQDTLPSQTGNSGKVLGTNGSAVSWVTGGTGGGGTGDVTTNTTVSVESEVALFTGTSGKALKRATGSGVAKLTAGVLSTAVAGTDYVAPGGALGTPASGNLANCTGLPAAAIPDGVRTVTVVTGTEARPATTGVVMWIGGTTQPSSYDDTKDIWFGI